jgi:hypothetical protein
MLDGVIVLAVVGSFLLVVAEETLHMNIFSLQHTK